MHTIELTGEEAMSLFCVLHYAKTVAKPDDVTHQMAKEVFAAIFPSQISFAIPKRSVLEQF